MISKEFSLEISKCLEVLSKGGTILYPTDTIWGIGCSATDEQAVANVFTLKKRADSKTMIILVDTEERLSTYIEQVPEQAWQLIEYSEKPLTLVLPGARNVVKNLVAEDGSIAIRIVKDDFCRQLIFRFRRPIVSTSANFSGDPSPANFSDINEEIKSSVDYVVALRQQESHRNSPSRIIKLGLKGEIKIIR